MSKEIRIGLLGFGAMGRAHTFSVSALPFYYEGLNFKAKCSGCGAQIRY